MNILSSAQILERISNIIHEDTQLHQSGIDLTVNAIERFTQRGSLDFGGSEFEPAGTESIKPKKKNEEDDYGWWFLETGTYKAKFNEEISLDDDICALITLHDHARKAGLLANTNIIESSGKLSMVFEVPSIGCNIKENARLAILYLINV